MTRMTLSFDPADAFAPPPDGEISNPGNARMSEGMVVVDVDFTPAPPPPPPEEAIVTDLLKRTNLAIVSGESFSPYRKDSPGDRFLLDARHATFYYDTNDATSAPISIGKGSHADSPAVLGGNIVGRIPWDAPWQEVKDKWDAAAVRLEGAGEVVCYGVRIVNIEDGFEPHPAVNPNGNLTNTFRLERAYMEHIRDDAIENDQGMPGVIRDVYVEIANRFLSEQLDSQNITNPGSVVKIERCLVHMGPMPNARASDGKGYGGVFKWMQTGTPSKVAVSDTMFLLDEPPIASNTWPPGTYTNTTVVLAPSYPGSARPSYLPAGVTVTREMAAWTAAVAAWKAAHPDLVR